MNNINLLEGKVVAKEGMRLESWLLVSMKLL